MSYVELRTGRLPYPELSPAAIIRAKLDGTLDLSDLSPAEAKVVAKALAVDPARRWQSCVEFVKAVRAAVPAGGGSTGAIVIHDSSAADVGGADVETADIPADPAATPRGARGRLPRAALVGLSLAGLAAAGLGGFMTVRGRPATISRETAISLERAGRFAAAGDAHARLLAGRPDELAAVLWDLQTQAADAGRPADCVPLLRRLERMYAATPPPRVQGISRWDVVNSLAWYLATDPAAGADAGAESTRLANEGLALAGRDQTILPQALDTAAAAAARAGDFATAVARIDEAIVASGDAAARDDFSRRRESYIAQRAWDEP